MLVLIHGFNYLMFKFVDIYIISYRLFIVKLFLILTQNCYNLSDFKQYKVNQVNFRAALLLIREKRNILY